MKASNKHLLREMRFMVYAGFATVGSHTLFPELFKFATTTIGVVVCWRLLDIVDRLWRARHIFKPPSA